jgi:low affinity Fe/Cu permease
MKPDAEVKPADKIFDKISTKVTKATGSPVAFITAFLVIVVWAVTGPIFHFSDTWQLVINTGTTIITFLMVFIIQQSANKDTMAIQLKLNELIAANKNASNQLVDIEDLTEAELQTVKKFYIRLADKAEAEDNLTKTHTFAEADENAARKSATREPEKPKKNNGTGKAVS